jgi:lysozyme
MAGREERQPELAAVIAVQQAAIDLAKRFEGFHRVPRNDPSAGRIRTSVRPASGRWAMAHLCAPDLPPVTQAEAEACLAQDLQVALHATLRHRPVLATEPPQRLAAVVDFCFNLGAGRLQTSTLRRRINQRDWAEAAREMRRWVHAGGRVLPGLQGRREVAAQWLLGDTGSGTEDRSARRPA